MSFKVGDRVKWQYGHTGYATIIGIPDSGTEYCLLGWKRGDPLYGWTLYEGDDRLNSWGPITIIHGMFSNFVSAFWVHQREVRLVQRGDDIKTQSYPRLRVYSCVSRKWLQKRMRDQLAQQFLISRG